MSFRCLEAQEIAWNPSMILVQGGETSFSSLTICKHVVYDVGTRGTSGLVKMDVQRVPVCSLHPYRAYWTQSVIPDVAGNFIIVYWLLMTSTWSYMRNCLRWIKIECIFWKLMSWICTHMYINKYGMLLRLHHLLQM